MKRKKRKTADARRLDWLQNNKVLINVVGSQAHICYYHPENGIVRHFYGPNYRAVIDLAMFQTS